MPALRFGQTIILLGKKTRREWDAMANPASSADQLTAALGRIETLENDLRGVLAFIRVLDRLRPTCVLCHDETADRLTINGPACSDCVGDLPDDGPDPERPETWTFPGPEEFGPEAYPGCQCEDCRAAREVADMGPRTRP
jgi:hypothetical protein